MPEVISKKLFLIRNIKHTSKITFALVTIFGLSGLSGVANAQEKISKDEAQALVKKIIAFAKANGEEKTIAVYNTPEYIIKGDGYIFAYDSKAVNACHKNEKMQQEIA